MKLFEFLKIYFGPYKFYNIDKKHKKVLETYCKKNELDSVNELGIILVMLNKRKLSEVGFWANDIIPKLGLYSIKSKVGYYITNDKKMISKIKKLNKLDQESNELHAMLGKMLSYPSCCIKHFLLEKKMYLPKMQGFDNFIFHALCKPECKKTEKLKRYYANAIKLFCPKMYFRLLGLKYCLTHLDEI